MHHYAAHWVRPLPDQFACVSRAELGLLPRDAKRQYRSLLILCDKRLPDGRRSFQKTWLSISARISSLVMTMAIFPRK